MVSAKPSTLLAYILSASFFFCGFLSSTCADEVVIADGQCTHLSLGDFSCSSCSDDTLEALGILSDENSGVVSAGDLWKFFDQQGVESLDRLVLCLDLKTQDENFDLQSMELKIEDPFHHGELLTHVSTGSSSLIVPGSETSEYKPEAKLEILLGYDFMKKFTANSTEKIELNFSSNANKATAPAISIASTGQLFTKSNTGLLLAFVGFWITVFFVLNRVTKPMVEEKEATLPQPESAKPIPSPHAGIPAEHRTTDKRALSA